MRVERIQARLELLEGWVLNAAPRSSGDEVPAEIWTAFELSDHLEASELVGEIGRIADAYCVTPEIDVRRNRVFVRATTPKVGLTEDDFDFAEAVDFEVGSGRKAPVLSAGRRRRFRPAGSSDVID